MASTNFAAVSTLTSYLKKDALSSPNRFTVQFIRLPRIPLIENNNYRTVLEALRTTTFLCNIPTLQIMTEPLTLYGGTPEYYIPKKRRNDSIDISIYVTNTFLQRNFFEAWAHTISDIQTNNVGYYDEITGDLKISVYAQNGDIIYDVDYMNAYPSSLSQIRLTWLITEEWTEQQISFNYEYFRVNKATYTRKFSHIGVSY